MKFFTKFLGIVLVFSILVSNNLPYLIVCAQEEPLSSIESPSPTEVPQATIEPELVVENTAEISDVIDSNANTGENEINISTPIVVTTETPISAETPEPTNEPISEIVTSDSITLTEVENNINSNSINSEFIYHTLNIYLPETGDIDLSKLTANVINKVYGQDANLSEIVNLKVTTVDNFAYIENKIESISNSGTNNIDATGNSSITTGDSYSIVSVLNNINTNIIDSKMHLVTINIFGNMTGNIILPEISGIDSCVNCSADINLSNNAEVTNHINSTANTGENKIELNASPSASPSAEISTGESASVVNVLNLVNINFINTVFKYIYINTLGTWVGNFLGWLENNENTKSDEVPIDGSCANCDSSRIDGTNTASVSNSINSMANTGGNLIKSHDNSEITTGNAYSSVSLVNMVNTNVINSTGFIGFVNIFGTFVGDIGGASFFNVPDIPAVIKEEPVDQVNEEPKKESGGILEVTHINNVGTHVLPGDTVTFMIKANNIGYGKIYNTKITIELFKDGVSYGGTYFNIGDINAQKTIKLSTGLVMSKKALSGNYNVIVRAVGIVGPENSEVSSSSESEFKIVGFNTVLSPSVNLPPIDVEPHEIIPEVLGTNSSDSMINKIKIIFSWLLILYLGLKSIQKRQQILGYTYRMGNLLM